MVVRGQRLRRPADRAFEQRRVAALGDRGLEQLAKDRRHLRRAQAGADPGLDHPAEPRRIETLQHLRDQLRRTLAKAPPCPLRRIGQPAGDRARHVEAAGSPGDDDRDQEIGAEELRERVADPVLVARHYGCVRDRQAERMAEQRGHREPVRQPTDHRRLRERTDEREGGVGVDERAADEERRGHEHEQPGRDDPHADEGGRRCFARRARAG